MGCYFFDMDGTLAVYDRWVYVPDGRPWYEKIRGTHYYRHLKSHPEMVRFVTERLEDDPASVYILTSIEVPLDIFYEHAADKIGWVQEHLPGLLPQHFLIAAARHPRKGSVTKSLTAMQSLGRMLGNEDYLYDDYNPNLEDWRDAGGTPVKVLNGINHSRPDMRTFQI